MVELTLVSVNRRQEICKVIGSISIKKESIINFLELVAPGAKSNKFSCKNGYITEVIYQTATGIHSVDVLESEMYIRSLLGTT